MHWHFRDQSARPVLGLPEQRDDIKGWIIRDIILTIVRGYLKAAISAAVTKSITVFRPAAALERRSLPLPKAAANLRRKTSF